MRMLRNADENADEAVRVTSTLKESDSALNLLHSDLVVKVTLSFLTSPFCMWRNNLRAAMQLCVFGARLSELHHLIAT